MDALRPPPRRLPDWRPRLLRTVRAAGARPFDWGRHDCALFAADAVEAVTGHDPAAAFRGRYRTPRGALRVLRGAGFSDLTGLVVASLPEVGVLRARPGDLVALPVGDIFGAALGVAAGAHVWVLRPDGLGLLPLTAAARAWAVGGGGR